MLHNRAGLFSLDAAHPNALAPGKRPYHTIIPRLATRDGELLYCYGMMGAFMQPQGHLQLINNMVDHGMDPQQAVNALRFMVGNDQALLEEGVNPDTARELQSRGHRLGLMAGRQRIPQGRRRRLIGRAGFAGMGRRPARRPGVMRWGQKQSDCPYTSPKKPPVATRVAETS